MIGQGRICGVIAAETAGEATRQFRAATGGRAGARILELRLDYLRSEKERSRLLAWLARGKRRPTLIATCRTQDGGGRFAGPAEEELRILAAAARAGCQWCDVELETAERMAPAALRRVLSPARLLVSAHDFRRVPADLRGLVRRLERCRGDAIKIAAACHCWADVRRLLAIARRRNTVVIPMGEDVLAGRILALRAGSALAYAAVGPTTAPGQFTLEAAENIYRLGRRFGRSARGISPDTRVYGVIGDPIGHSLSPLMHNAAFAAQGLNAILLPFRVRELEDFLGCVEAFGIRGFAVTLPHKERVLRYLDECDPLAAEVGAVNTVVVGDGGRLRGYNTDYLGVLRALAGRLKPGGSRVLLVGAGGVARAAAFALARAGAAVVVLARKPERARALARAVGGEAVERGALRRERFDAIVNCTPVGLHPGGGSPLTADELNGRVVMDLIYRPRRTKLLRLAERRGIETISGVEMFVAQGAAQWELWTRRRAPAAAMRRAVIAALDREEGAARR